MTYVRQLTGEESASIGSWDFALKAVSIANKLTKTLCSSGELRSDLVDFTKLLGLNYAKIARVYKSRQPRPTVRYVSEVCVNTSSREEHLFGNLTNPVLSQLPSSPKVGSVWTLTDMSSEFDPSSPWIKGSSRLGIQEIIMSVLDTSQSSVDVLELYLPQPASSLSLGETEKILGACKVIEAAWKQRNRQSIERLISALPQADNVVNFTEAKTLSHENPLGLTRAEFTVCRHLLTGASVSQIAKRISVQPNTVRTHLSSIFNKTGTSRQSELILFLLSGAQRDSLSDFRDLA